MNYAIIAAGEGSRLKAEGFESVKPLVMINGEYLIERLIHIFKKNSAKTVSIIINEQSDELEEMLKSIDWGIEIHLIVKSTPSSLHSFWNIIHNNSFSEVCLTTVDTVFDEEKFSKYISYFKRHKEIDALMATTKYIDDEKPLYINTDNDGNILEFLDKCPSNNINYVSAGIYCFREKSLKVADKCIKNNISRMRNFQRSLVEHNLYVKAYDIGKVIDIDHVSDIEKAKQMLVNSQKHILAIYRNKMYSPQSAEKDKGIMDAIVKALIAKDYKVNVRKEMKLDEKKDFAKYVISMARDNSSIQTLSNFGRRGSIVINSALGVRNCCRAEQIRILQKNKIPIPQSIIVDTDNRTLDEIDFLNEGNFWIKRGDFQTIQRNDVVRVKNLKSAYKTFENYQNRGIKQAVISQHIEGDVIKFYGLGASDWFYFYYPKKDKFGAIINEGTKRNKFNKQNFIHTCRRSAKVLDLDIYGGDAIIDAVGRMYIIDMNDFPSFSACKEEACENIVKASIKKWKL